jgi:hypothetical protein
MAMIKGGRNTVPVRVGLIQHYNISFWKVLGSRLPGAHCEEDEADWTSTSTESES